MHFQRLKIMVYDATGKALKSFDRQKAGCGTYTSQWNAASLTKANVLHIYQ